MDTKLRKSNNIRKSVCFGSSVIFIISAVVTFVLSLIMITAYQFAYHYTTVPEIQGVISKLWIAEVPAILIVCASLVASIVTCGVKNEDGRVKLNWFDKIFDEIQIAAAFLAGAAFLGSGYMIVDYIESTSWCTTWIEYAYNSIPMNYKHDFEIESIDDIYNWMVNPTPFEPKWVELAFGIILTAAIFAFLLIVVLSLGKKIKGRCFWRNTIIGKIVCYIKGAADKSDDVFWKVMITLIVACLLSATWVGTVVVLALIVIFVPKMLAKYQAVKDGVDEVRCGNLEYKIPVEDDDNGELANLARNVNEISSATNVAVQNELKNQRLKTDLISNVSHDLKTPLTSMVSYIDLLKREGLDSENAPEYLDIIDEKTQRLKKLTEDLFEAAKASSGAIPVNLEKIEMTSIVNQALGELDEKLSANDLHIVFSPKADVNFVMADGQLLWRVIENLLVNVSKYALPGSRVYLDITEKGENMILLEVKNVSNEQLNIDAEELMERFKRGDDSRNTEGSGLGLAIAKDLTKLMNGWFEISIDGDLFKASVALMKAE